MCLSITFTITLNENFAARVKGVWFSCRFFIESAMQRFLHRNSSIYGAIPLSLSTRVKDEITRPSKH